MSPMDTCSAFEAFGREAQAYAGLWNRLPHPTCALVAALVLALASLLVRGPRRGRRYTGSPR